MQNFHQISIIFKKTIDNFKKVLYNIFVRLYERHDTMVAELEIYKNKKVFFSGIGGVSMSSLALILKDNGFLVCGSDRAENANVKKLKDKGINIIIGQTAENITDDIGLVVRTAAVSTESDEMKKAEALGIPIMERCTLLGYVMKAYKNRFNICGTHGKTTTTSMVALILIQAGLDPTVTVGGDFKKIGGNLRIGSMNYFVCEACEYVESFLEFYPSDTLILNVEEDHLDYYKDINHIKSAFRKFAQKTEHLIVANGDSQNVIDAVKDLPNVVFFGLENGKYTAKNIKTERLTTQYDLYCDGVFLAHITLKVAGLHNVVDSLGACALCLENGIDISYIKSALFDFGGADRRMEYKGTFMGADIYDDYAHHPTEIETTVKSARQKCPKRIVALFQPHTYTRTKAFKDDFKRVLSLMDKVYIADIYAAREKNPGNISSRDIADGLNNAVYVGSLENALLMIENELKEGDMFITIGAGDVYKVGESLIKKAGECV